MQILVGRLLFCCRLHSRSVGRLRLDAILRARPGSILCARLVCMLHLWLKCFLSDRTRGVLNRLACLLNEGLRRVLDRLACLLNGRLRYDALLLGHPSTIASRRTRL